MAVDPTFRAHVRAQLSQLVALTDRAMFGGVGVYADGRIIGLLSDETLYLKADDESREAFLAAGSFPFAPNGMGGQVMSYYAIPRAVLDDIEALRPWAERAVAAALRAEKKKRKPRKHDKDA
jgi:DNA transformation protein and related proteins